MHEPALLSSDVLLEATDLTAFALDVSVHPSLDALATAANDDFTMHMILGIAHHVCGLRARQADEGPV